MVGGPAFEWVPMDGSVGGSAVGELAAAVGGCVGCNGWVGQWWVVFISFLFFCFGGFDFLMWWV